jgi:alpha,alpha-trehalose phosphorylase
MILKRHNRLGYDLMFVDEAIFTTQNRYLGVRGNFEEQPKQTHHTIRGTYINGVYDTHEIIYGEEAYGFPKKAQTIVNVPDAQTILIKVQGETLTLDSCKVLDLKRYYHIKEGLTVRKITYQTIHPYTFTLTFKRLAHLIYKELFVIDVTIESHDYDGAITIESTINGDVKNYENKKDPRAASSHAKKIQTTKVQTTNQYALLSSKTIHTGLDIHVLMWHSELFEYKKTTNEAIGKYKTKLKPGSPINIKKYVLYGNSLDHNNPEDFLKKTKLKIEKIDIYQKQKDALTPFFNHATIEIDTDDRNELEDIIMYNLYQLYTAGGSTPRTNIPAKGLTGEGYEGHTFWDTEIYMLPFFMQIDPSIAKNLLLNRYEQLSFAKEEAKKLGVQEGVKFAWRTINGEETSAYYPAGTAQYHINSDIAYAFIKNYQLHNEFDFFLHQGLKVLIETARFFKHVVTEHNGKYHLHSVTGPDEYTAIVDDNYYTNALLKYQLRFMLDFIKTNSRACELILHELNVNEQELNQFEAIEKNIVLPFEPNLKIDLQDTSFITKKTWDFEHTPVDHYPLLLHYHPLTIYRHKVLKQADTVLAHFLLNNRPIEVMTNSYAYYEPLTTHDSSLSSCIYASQAARLGLLDEAYKHFKETLALDLDNTHKNTQIGLHIANLGGMYLAIIYGFIGLSIQEVVSINPRLPKEWTRLKLKIRLKEDIIVTLELTQSHLTLSASESIELNVYGNKIQVKDTATISTTNNSN